MRANVRVFVMAIVAAMVMAGCRDKNATAVTSPPPVPPKPPATDNGVRVAAPKPELVTGPVRIDVFSVEPTAIERGQSATLRWSVANATDVTIDQGLGTVTANGSRQIFPTTTTTYTLTARSTNGTDSRLVTVEVRVPAPPPPKAPTTSTQTLSAREIFTREMQADVLFDYDMSELRPDARAALDNNARVLRQIFMIDPAFNVVIEGHADERGTAEYNLGLADRRATAVREYLIQAGIPANRLRTISFGEERPACTDMTEACYQRNRRAHFESAQ